jgi:hypothetical protein
MDAGQIAEFDHPLALFDRPDSIFRSMCDAAKLSREAIVRIRAGENARKVEEEMGTGEQPNSDVKGMDEDRDESYQVEETVRKADEAYEIVAAVPNQNHAIDKQKD